MHVLVTLDLQLAPLEVQRVGSDPVLQVMLGLPASQPKFELIFAAAQVQIVFLLAYLEACTRLLSEQPKLVFR